MRKKIGFCLALFLMGAASLHASEGFDDLVKLIKSGIGEDVQIAYIDTSKVSFDLTPDEILYLKDLGVNEKVITRVMQRGKSLRDGDATVADAAPLRPVVRDPFSDDADLPPLAERVPELPLIFPQAGNVPPEETAAVPVPSTPLSRVGGDVAKGPLVNEPGVVDPVIGKPEPIRREALNDAPPRELPEREIVRETRETDEQPVYVDRPVYIDRTVVTAPAGPTDQTLFYEALSPYGSWVEVDDSWYWQPTVVTVERGWKPYSNRGRWLYTDAGWTWQSEYSWGWAAFHYGRWDNHPRYGWIWHPDNVWGPAWVSWRSDDRYAGWAPLPRHAHYDTEVGFSFRGKNVSVNFNFGLSERDYCFVPVEYVHDEHVYEHRLRPAQVTNIYNDTTVINNTYVYNDNRIINQGVPVDRVRQASRTEIRPTRIVDANVKAGQPIQNNQLKRNELVVFRPTVTAARPAQSPRVVLGKREAELNAKQTAETRAAALRRVPTVSSTQTRPATPEREPRRTAEESQKRPLIEATRREAAPTPSTAAEIARRRVEETTARNSGANVRKGQPVEAPRAESRTEPLRSTTGRVTAPAAESRTTGNGRDMVMDGQRKAGEAAKIDLQRIETQKRNDAAYEAQRKAEAGSTSRREAEKQNLETRARQESETRKQQATTELKSSQQSQDEAAARREQSRREVQARNDAAMEAQRNSAAASAAGQARMESARNAAEERVRRVPEKTSPSVDTGSTRTSPPVAPPVRRQPAEERRAPPAPVAPPAASTQGLTPAEAAKQEFEERREKARRR